MPSIPGWTVYDLVTDLGNAYRRAALHIARAGEPDPPGGEAETPDEADVVAWWDHKLAELTHLLTKADPRDPAWNWSHKPHEAIFFHRRLAHETALRRWDAQLSVTLPEPLDPPEMAADGVDEVLDTFLPSDNALPERIAVTGAVRLVASDIGAHWVVRVRANGVSLLDTGSWFDDEPEVATIAKGTASDLLLLLRGRLPISVVDVQGEERLVESLLVTDSR